MPLTLDGNGIITGASTLATTVASPTFTTPNINSAQFATVSGTAPIYPCRAWVNFNGTGTVAIRASGNVTSITDNGQGDFTANFTTAMPDVNYATLANGLGTTNTSMQPGGPRSQATNLTTSVRFGFGTLGNAGATNTATDPEVANVSVFR